MMMSKRRKTRVEISGKILADEIKPRIRITSEGLRYLKREHNFSDEDLRNYRGSLGDLCEQYRLVRGAHYTLKGFTAKFKFNRSI